MGESKSTTKILTKNTREQGFDVGLVTLVLCGLMRGLLYEMQHCENFEIASIEIVLLIVGTFSFEGKRT